jgi:hypothetical protein
MNNHYRQTIAAAGFALGALLAACGGGGSGGSGTPPTNSTTAPAVTGTPNDTGTLSVSGLSFAGVPVVYTCGCSGEGGEVTTNSSGGYQVSESATAIPASAAPYTPPGHNIMVVGYAANSQTQAWTMVFLGSTPTSNLNLSSTPTVASANVNDTAATAAALYIYYEAAYSTAITGSDRTFDWFNFNQIDTFAEHLRTSPSTDESKFLSDITSAQQSNSSLYPGFVPTWNAISGDGTNTTLASDIAKIASDGTSVDSTLPTPCPGADDCTGAPTP